MKEKMVFEQVITATSENLVMDIGLLIIGATILALISRFFKQPLIPAYIILGVLVGPVGLNLIKDPEIIKSLSEIGIAFLLFVVGLEIDIQKLKKIGATFLITGLIQTILIFSVGYAIAVSIGFTSLVAIYIGLVTAFSSTMVVIKLLADEDEVNTVHGRIILSILLVEDFIAMIALAALSTINPTIDFTIIGGILFKGFLIILLGLIVTRFISPRLFQFAAKSNELLFLCSVTMCFFFAAMARLLGFSIVIGTFIAGIGLATLRFTTDIKSRVVPIKDFFATLFFVSLGMQLIFTGLDKLIQPTVIFLAILMLLKPITAFILTIMTGYGNKVAFLSANSLGQVSEFSLILVTSGLALGHISQKIFSLTIILAIITMMFTSYSMKHNHAIHNKISWFLKPWERIALRHHRLEYDATKKKKQIILIGCSRIGTIMIDKLKKMNKDILVIENNPDIILKLIKNKIPCKYGDGTSRELLKSINIEQAPIVISTLPSCEDNEFILNYIKNKSQKTKVIVLAKHVSQSFRMYDCGADYVIVPHVLSGERVAEILESELKKSKSLHHARKEHINHLEHLESFDLN